jgi:hypothetical protein
VKEVIVKKEAQTLILKFMKGKKVANKYEDFRAEMKMKHTNDYFKEMNRKRQTDA